MAIPALSIVRNYAARTILTEAQLDAQNDSIESWASQVVTRGADLSGTVTVTGTWTFDDFTLSNNIIKRSNGDQWTIPAGANTFIGDTLTQTLTNKTLTSPTISSPTLSGTIVLPATDPPAANALTQRSICKGWAFITWAAGVPAVTASYNVSGVVDTGVGDVEIDWNTDFANANYAVVAIALDPGGTDPFICSYVTKGTSSVNVRVRNRSAGALTDPTSICVIAFGDQ